MEGGPPARPKRGPQLVGKKEGGHGKNEYVPGDVVALPYPGNDAESFRGCEHRLEAHEQVRVGLWCKDGS